jgi:Glycosyl hydrolases family 18
MNPKARLVNAWILLDENHPPGTNYDSPSSCYQRLIQNDIYQSVDILFVCFVDTIPTGANTIPTGNGTSYTVEVANRDYMEKLIRDARKINRNIKIVITLKWDPEKGDQISRIFSNHLCTPEVNASNFAKNLMAYLNYKNEKSKFEYNLDGFDIDWEDATCRTTTKKQFKLLINAIRSEFKRHQTDKKYYYLTLSPAEVGNLDVTIVNDNIDFVNLQLYSGFTFPKDFKEIKSELFAYGAKFEAKEETEEKSHDGYQSAQDAYKDNGKNYHYTVFTCWRLNSGNYEFEQQQQQLLYRMAKPSQGRVR